MSPIAERMARSVVLLLAGVAAACGGGSGGGNGEPATDGGGPPVANGIARLSWYAPTNRTDGSPLTDLAGFEIYYSESQMLTSRDIRIESYGWAWPIGLHFLSAALE
jgi:hypothetical protein